MSNLDADSDIVTCQPIRDGSDIEILEPRSVPLGGLRAMPVRRTLPQRRRSLIGAWCFADHYGPDDVDATGGMRVAPHPHTGLQTVSWLFTGEIEHRDSIGSHAMVRPGEVNLMTAGRGIAHSEVSTPATTTLHGAQLWVALPESARATAPAFEHYAPEPVYLDGGRVGVFLGSLAGATSPVRTFTPLLGAEIVLAPGARLTFDVDPEFEHGVLVDAGPVEVCGALTEPAHLAYVPPGRDRLPIHNATGGQARVLLLGGPPFGEQIIMWWNFVGRTSDEIADFRTQWQAEIGENPPATTQFMSVPGYEGDPIPAPTLPATPLKPRG